MCESAGRGGAYLVYLVSLVHLVPGTKQTKHTRQTRKTTLHQALPKPIVPMYPAWASTEILRRELTCT